MSFHAEILGDQISKGLEPVSPQAREKLKEISVIKKNSESRGNKERDIGSLESPIESAVEPTGIIDNSPWTMAMDKYLRTNETVDLDSILENVLNDRKENAYDFMKAETSNSFDGTRESPDNKDNFDDEHKPFMLPRSAGSISVIQCPEMIFSMEELNFLNQQKVIHTNISRQAMPISLHQARLAHYLGHLSIEGMLSVVAGGRKAQNYYHYQSMISQPYFNELTVRLAFGSSIIYPLTISSLEPKTG